MGQGVTGQPGSPPPKSHHIPAPDVDGRQAYWASSSATDALDDDRPMLRWRTADGRWAELTASGFPAQGLEQTMLRTAAGITLGTRPVPLPFYISGWPVPTQVGTFNLSADAVQELNMHGWGFDVEFAVSGYRFGVSVSQYVTAPENFNTPDQTTVWAEANGMLYRIDHEGSGKLPRALTAIGGYRASSSG
ncbi:hypothetical protein GXW82_41865 [Streptacidiphilus sp. 4-A2]|nr:hypothetical protein [Streptacidiphilus sp. 4-A2]